MITRASVRWRCRRGMRELDLLLQEFLARGFDACADSDVADLARLLERPDQDILAWLTASREPPRELEAIVARIRTALD